MQTPNEQKPERRSEDDRQLFGRLYHLTGIPREQRMVYILLGLTVLLLLLTLLVFFAFRDGDAPADGETDRFGDPAADSGEESGDEDPAGRYLPASSDATVQVPEALLAARNAILVRGDTLEVLAEKEADTVLYPASLTKIMTLLTAVELATDLDATVTVTRAQVDYAYSENAKTVGFEIGEVVTVRDLLYAVALESCAVSAMALAEQLSGSEEAFVAQMNRNAAAMGLVNTHFTNTVGLHDDDHVTTARELAAIFAYAMENALCKEILTSYSYRTVTNRHQYGITCYSTLLRGRFADNQVDVNLASGHTVLGGKTGYTSKAAYCLATYATASDGTPYLLITCGGPSSRSTVDDCLAMFETYGVVGV